MSKLESCNKIDTVSRTMLEMCIKSVGHASDIGELDRLNGIVEAIRESHESVEKAHKLAVGNIH